MEQQHTAPATTPEVIQDAEFRKRRTQKNWIVMALIMGSVALVWAVTMIKIQNGLNIAHPIGAVDSSAVREVPQPAAAGDKNVQ